MGQWLVRGFHFPKPTQTYPALTVEEQQWVKEQMELCEDQAPCEVLVVRQWDDRPSPYQIFQR